MRPKHIDCERCGASVRDTSDDSLWERHCRWHRDQMALVEQVERLQARVDAEHPLDPPSPANKDRAPRDGDIPSVAQQQRIINEQQRRDADAQRILSAMLPLASPKEIRRFLFGERGE